MAEELTHAGSVLLSALAPSERAKLIQTGRAVHFAPGETIFSRGAPGDTVLIINSGRAEVSILSRSGRKSVINHMGESEVIGEIAVLDGGERSADVVAATDVTGVILTRTAILEFLRARPDAMVGVIGELCGRVRNASEMFAAQSHKEANARLARCLLRLARKWGEPQPDGAVHIKQAFSQTDLGEYAGLARENVNRYMKIWTKSALVQYSAEQITLLDLDGLEDLADA